MKKLKTIRDKHRKIAWVCDKCNWLQVSDSREHHKMDFCRCKDREYGCGVDLEEYGCRFSNFPRIIAEQKEGEPWKVKLSRRRKYPTRSLYGYVSNRLQKLEINRRVEKSGK